MATKKKSQEDKLKEKIKKQLEEQQVSTAEEAPKAEEETKESRPGSAPYTQPNRFLTRMAKKKDVAMFFRELAILVEAGYPIMRALTLLANKTTNRHFAGDIDRIAQMVERGNSLGKALANFPWYFPPMTVSMIEAGESSGRLADSLSSIADDFDLDEELSDKIAQAMSYPVLTAIFACLAALVILLFVVPTFADVYEKNNMPLPPLTQLLVWASSTLTDFWWLWLPAIAVGIWAVRKRVLQSIDYFDGVFLKIPLVRDIIILGAMARFTASLNILVSNGVSILQSIELATGVVNNSAIRKVLMRTRDSVERGKSLAEPLAKAGFFPPIMVDMMMVGEESGTLPFVLGQTTKAMRASLEQMIGRFSVILGPILTLVVGVLVLFVTLSLFIPYFDFMLALANIN